MRKNEEKSEYKFYKKPQKLKFMENKSIDYRSIFETTYDLEIDLDKDLSDFSLEQFEYAMTLINPNSEGYAAGVRVCFQNYIDFVKINTDYINPIKTITEFYKTKKEWSNQFVPSASTFLSDSKILEIENLCLNKQDAVIFRLLFIGLNKEEVGYLMFSNVKKEYIELNNRQIKIDERDYNLIIDAYTQPVYKQYNPAMQKKARPPLPFLDIDKDYVVKRTTKRNTIDFARNSPQFIADRIKNVAILLRLGDISATDISQSGLLYASKDYFKNTERERLSGSDYMKLGYIFGLTTMGILSSICTLSNIQKVYGDISSYNAKKPKFIIGEENRFWEYKEINGDKGEKFVRHQLGIRYKDSEYGKVSAINGYDFYVENDEFVKKHIEVKTIMSTNGRIILSRNELEKARIHDDDYYIFIVLLSEDLDKSTCYEVRNPIKFFGINCDDIPQNFCDNIFDLQMCSYSFEIRLNDYFLKQLINPFK